MLTRVRPQAMAAWPRSICVETSVGKLLSSLKSNPSSATVGGAHHRQRAASQLLFDVSHGIEMQLHLVAVLGAELLRLALECGADVVEHALPLLPQPTSSGSGVSGDALQTACRTALPDRPRR